MHRFKLFSTNVLKDCGIEYIDSNDYSIDAIYHGNFLDPIKVNIYFSILDIPALPSEVSFTVYFPNLEITNDNSPEYTIKCNAANNLTRILNFSIFRFQDGSEERALLQGKYKTYFSVDDDPFYFAKIIGTIISDADNFANLIYND